MFTLFPFQRTTKGPQCHQGHIAVFKDPAIGEGQEEIPAGLSLQELKVTFFIRSNNGTECPEAVELTPECIDEPRDIGHLPALGNNALNPAHEDLDLAGGIEPDAGAGNTLTFPDNTPGKQRLTSALLFLFGLRLALAGRR